MSNSLDPVQDRHSVSAGPDLGPKYLQRLSEDNQSCHLQRKELS